MATMMWGPEYRREGPLYLQMGSLDIGVGTGNVIKVEVPFEVRGNMRGP